MRGVGLPWVSMMRLVPVPWSRRVWALPFLAVLSRPAEKGTRRRQKTRVDWVRPMMQHVRRWLPDGRLVLGSAGGLAAVSLALAYVQNRVTMVAPALGCRAGSSPRTAAPGQAWPQTLAGETPAQLAGLGGALGYPLGERRSGLVRRRAQQAVGLLAPRAVVHPGVAPCHDPLCPGG